MQTVTDTHRTGAESADRYFDYADQSFGECRQRLISYLVKLNHALNDGLPDLSHALLTRFCDSLVDYLSRGPLPDLSAAVGARSRLRADRGHDPRPAWPSTTASATASRRRFRR